ncbi:hypothetical protein JK628_06190 [Shewanella sp. KX20019]|uniref:protein YgfX n=1 Tax=Shewanella sp. KX20019 TaxID=2803864 RepID=UPI001925BCB3|nr:protein YgfX [Shewanella sp. KX20019]QQX81449.1 hypothetical protein JK628_06190 [Shewanella sp. KX20019]
MVAQQHSFHLSSSFDQRFSLVVVASLCFISFMVWPYGESFSYLFCKSLIFILSISYFSWQFWQLKHWSCQFILSAEGNGRLNQKQGFVIKGKPMITPFALMFDIQCETEVKRLVVWADMLDDTSYRHLCRLLLQSNQRRLN